MSDKLIEFEVTGNYEDTPRLCVHTLEHDTPTAALAKDIAVRWALVVAIPDGEDSAGRQKLRMPTAVELADRASDIAETLMAKLKLKGHIISVPSLADMHKEYAEKKAAKKKPEPA